MNKTRRKMLQEILDKLTELKEELGDIRDEEEEYRDNIPENLQGSERYQATDGACDVLNEAVSQLEEVCGVIETLVEE